MSEDGFAVYGTHAPLLAAMVQCTTGPVLEMGAGWYSTPMLHLMCQQRRLVTLEDQHEWLAKFAEYAAPWHELRFVTSWQDVSLEPPEGDRWGLVFVDHSNSGQRAADLQRLRACAQFIVVHDTELHSPPGPVTPLLETFAHRKHFRRLLPNTSVVSDYAPVPLAW